MFPLIHLTCDIASLSTCRNSYIVGNTCLWIYYWIITWIITWIIAWILTCFWVCNGKCIGLIPPSKGIITSNISSQCTVSIAIGTCEYRGVVLASNYIAITCPTTCNDHLETVILSLKCEGQRSSLLVVSNNKLIRSSIPTIHITCDSDSRNHLSCALHCSYSVHLMRTLVEGDSDSVNTRLVDFQLVVSTRVFFTPCVTFNYFEFNSTCSECQIAFFPFVVSIALVSHHVGCVRWIPLGTKDCFRCTCHSPCCSTH